MQRYEVNLILYGSNGLLKDNNKRKIHISLSNRRFYNGYVVDILDTESMNFKDDVLGYIPIPYNNIIDIAPRVER